MFTVRISVAVEDFALSHALREVPDMEVKAARLAAHSRHWVMPCLWSAGGDFETFDSAIESDPTVEEIVSEAKYDDVKLYQLHWSEDIKQHLDVALDAKASLLNAETSYDDWQLTIRFASRDQFETFRAYLTEEGITFNLETMSQTTVPQTFTGGLTPSQREALAVAVSEGYFAIPREATMNDVADKLGISTQAASERLRRGIEEFVETMLVADVAELEN